MTEVLSPLQLKRLTEHKYSSEGTSLMEPFMQKFWRWAVEQIPLWWAPNAITLVGLVVNIATCLVLVYYSPDAKQEAPGVSLVICAIGLFLYQTLDAIDGKQARRTKSSSPLGELFDHGCDSLSTVFVLLSAVISLQLGHEPVWLFFECFAGMFMYYSAQWQTYVSGTMRFGLIDVTEGQFTVILLYIVTAIFGSSLWAFEIPVIGLPLKFLPVFFSIGCALLACRSYFSVIFMEGGSGKNGSTIAGTSVVFPVVPIASVILLGLMIWQKSTTGLFENHACLYIISFGMVACKITNRLVVGHMTKSEIFLLDSSFIGPAMLFFNQYFNELVQEYYVLWACCIFCTYDLLRYSIDVCTEICNHLNISCFSITPPPTVAKETNGKDTSVMSENSKEADSKQHDVHHWSDKDDIQHRPVTRASSRQTAKNS